MSQGKGGGRPRIPDELRRRCDDCGSMLGRGGARGYCNTHYQEHRRRGDFVVGPQRPFMWHGYYGTPTYRSWRSMIARCENPKHGGFHYYGGRGVKVCRRWHGFREFLADMGERPNGKTLDRINPFGNYSPRNCRWATPREQSNNTRRHYLRLRRAADVGTTQIGAQ